MIDAPIDARSTIQKQFTQIYMTYINNMPSPFQFNKMSIYDDFSISISHLFDVLNPLSQRFNTGSATRRILLDVRIINPRAYVKTSYLMTIFLY